MHFLFPCDPLNPRAPDDMFADQMRALEAAGFSTSLCSDEVIEGARGLAGIPPGSSVVYRGWMLNAEEYGRLAAAIESSGATPFTSVSEYLAAHHLPNWYPLISESTPETRIFPKTADMRQELTKLRWGAFFVKDYVKSLKTSIGSIIYDPAQIENVMAEMEKIRGEIEGGICVRRVEDFLPESERRYFVLNRQPHAPDASGGIPEAVLTCAGRIPSKFYSVDVITRRDGVLRIVEIGDGQVSDLVGWSPEQFARMWAHSLASPPARA
jgi:hypothetical protein